MPNPLQIIRAFRAHDIDNVPVSGDVTPWPRFRTAIPFAVPAEPISVRLSPPLDQNGRTEFLCVMRPSTKIDVEFAGNDFLKRKPFLGMFLIDIGAKHQTHVRDFPKIPDPSAHRGGKFS